MKRFALAAVLFVLIPALPGPARAAAPAPVVHGDNFRTGRTSTIGLPSVGEGAGALSGSHDVAAVMFNFSNDRSRPFTPEDVHELLFDGPGSVAGYYREVSFGGFDLTGDVHGWWEIPADNSGCDTTTWAEQATLQATLHGVDLTGYDHIVYVFPTAPSCWWHGLAYVNGPLSWINGYLVLHVFAHELGHNLGLHHASAYACTGADDAHVSMSETCSINEYGDVFDTMGGGPWLPQYYSLSRHFTGFRKGALGWLPPQDVSVEGDVALLPVESPGARVARVPLAGGRFLYLEYRRPSGLFDDFAADDPAVNGVSLRIAPDLDVVDRSLLIDATPETPSFEDAPLPVGRSFNDGLDGVAVTTVSADAAGAVVRVTFPPTAPTSLRVTSTGADRIALAWDASRDADGVTGYTVFRDGVPVGDIGVRTFDDTGLESGHVYTYAVEAIDASGKRSAPSRALRAATVDVVPPSAPPSLRVVEWTDTFVRIAWDRSSDNVGVTKYRIYRDGRSLGETTDTDFTNAVQRATTYTFEVSALDRAGNESTRSSITVTSYAFCTGLLDIGCL